MGLEEFNKHQLDVRTRTDTLAKAIFVLAGGALSISIGLFLNSKTKLSPEIVGYLQCSWVLLTLVIISLVLMLFTIITRDYFFGERWRRSLHKNYDGKVENHKPWDVAIWSFALVALVCFLIGFSLLSMSAILLLEGAN